MWPSVRLSRVARTVSGSGFPPGQQGLVEGDLPFVKVSDAANAPAAGLVGAANWVSRATARALGAREIPPGSTLLPKVGAALLNNNRAYTHVPCVADNNIMAVVPTDLEPRYMYWMLQTVDMGELSGGGTLPFVTDSQVRALEVPRPPTADQRRIADFLDEQVPLLDRAIALRTKEVGLAKEAQASFLHRVVSGQDSTEAMVTGRLPWTSQTPQSWPVAKIAHHAKLGSGHTPSRSRPEWWVNCTIPWITTGEVAQIRDDRVETLHDTRELLSQLGVANSSAEVHPAGTVVLSRTASAGFSAVMGRPMATSQDFVTWHCGPTLDPYYLLWCLRAMRSDLLGRLAMGSTHKTIYVPDIQTIKIPVPPLQAQREAVDRVRLQRAGLDDGIRLLIRQAELLRERKQALITAAVTGVLHVPTARSAA